MPNCELRSGSQHSNKDALEFIRCSLRKEPKEWWLSLAQRVGKSKSSREGKVVFTEEVSYIKVAGREDLAPVFCDI